jgi:adenylylsulfate kinase
MSGFALWLTGLPASGKSALARNVRARLHEAGVQVQILDSDDLRAVLTPQPTYSDAERDWFYDVMTYIGQLLTQNDVNVLFAATGARQHYRGRARQRIPQFAEVYVQCALATCMERDPKGLYAKARAGEIATLPGLQTPYEAPKYAEIVVNTAALTVDEGAQQIIEGLEQLSFVD